MNKPHWEKLHDWYMQDFRSWLEDRWFYILMARRHVDSPHHAAILQIIKDFDLILKRARLSYKKEYGALPKLNEIKKEVEI